MVVVASVDSVLKATVLVCAEPGLVLPYVEEALVLYPTVCVDNILRQKFPCTVEVRRVANPGHQPVGRVLVQRETHPAAGCRHFFFQVCRRVGRDAEL